MKARPQFKAEASKARALHRFAGRPKPVMLEGEAVDLALSVSGQLRDNSSTVDEYEAIATVPGVVLWREPTGRRVYALLAKVSSGRENHRWAEIEFDLTEVDYIE